MANNSKSKELLGERADFPKGWRMVRFDELARMVSERVDPSDTDADIYVGLEHLDSDTFKIRRWGTPSDVIGDKLQFRRGDIIFGRRRAYQRKLAVAEFDGICSAHAMVVRANEDLVISEFLPLLMQSDLFMQRAVDISVGSLSPTINWKTLRIQEFPLPPKDEQHRISEILWASESVCQATMSISQALEDLRLSIVAERFSQLRTTRCPADWRQVRLAKLFTNPKDTGYKDIEILSVTIDGRVVPRESLERSVIDKTGTEKYLRVLPGDIVYNTMRMWQGSCGVVDREGLVSPAYTVLRGSEPGYSAYFWNLAFHSPWMLDVFTRYSTGVASDRWRLYFRDFGRIEINIPPIEVAKDIEREFRIVAGALSKTIEKHNAERRLQISLRDVLLTGQAL